jgi:hypothetical protein
MVVFILHLADSIATVRHERLSVLQAHPGDRQKGEGHKEAAIERG